ncbi:MAG: hypothetical protein WA874_15050 [Chryseosolibacter sp.]
MKNMRHVVLLTLTLLSFPASAQFIDHFEGTGAPKGWVSVTGDGGATIDFRQKNGIATLYVDATKDKLNIWWALTRQRISGLDMKKLIRPEYELRVEARIRVSHAPRRVNLHVNHQRTTDFHSHLMEFDIPDTINWHTISMTTRDFETQMGDSINAHLALMDWGLGKYRIDFDYFKVDVVNRNSVGRDMGMPLPYHPPLADPASFPIQVVVAQDAIIDKQYADRNFNNWHTREPPAAPINVLSVNGTQIIIMRWDMNFLKGKKIKRAGLLELSPHSMQRSSDFEKDFGMIRITEIVGGDPAWNEKTITYDGLRGSQSFERVINTQMIIDDSVTWNKHNKVLFTISQPVMQRLIDGTTKGIAILPLGAVNASFYSRENAEEIRPRLYMEVWD